MADYKSEKPEIKQNKTEKKSKFNLGVGDEQEPEQFISDKKAIPETKEAETFDWENPKKIEYKTPKTLQPTLKKYRIVLLSKQHIVVDNNGNNQFVNGDFTGKKIGDMVELAL